MIAAVAPAPSPGWVVTLAAPPSGAAGRRGRAVPLPAFGSGAGARRSAPTASAATVEADATNLVPGPFGSGFLSEQSFLSGQSFFSALLPISFSPSYATVAANFDHGSASGRPGGGRGNAYGLSHSRSGQANPAGQVGSAGVAPGRGGGRNLRAFAVPPRGKASTGHPATPGRPATAKAPTPTSATIPAAAAGPSPGRRVPAVTPAPTVPAKGVAGGAPAGSAGGAPVRHPHRSTVLRAAAAALPAYERALDVPMIAAGQAWAALTVRAGTDLEVPVAFLLLLAAFLVVQALIDRRDPKVVSAPKRSREDSVGFE